MEFKTFDLGNALAQAEQIKGLRLNNSLAQQQQDPNSLQNQALRQDVDIRNQKLSQGQQDIQMGEYKVANAKKEQDLYFAHEQLLRLKDNPQEKEAVSKLFQERGLPPLQAGPFSLDEIRANAEKGIGIVRRQIDMLRQRKAAQTAQSDKIQNALYYGNANEAEQAAYDAANNNIKLVNQGNKITAVNPSLLIKKDAPLPVSLKPGEEPSVKGAQQAAKENAMINAAAAKESQGEIGKGSGKLAVESFSNMKDVRRTLTNIDKMVELVDKGASNSKIASFFPSFKSSTVELQNIRNQLGLLEFAPLIKPMSNTDVKIALDTELPSLPPKETKEYLLRKKRAMGDLLDYYEHVTSYLGKPGNTVSTFTDEMKARQARQGGSSAIGVSSKKPALSDDELLKAYGIK